MPITGIYRKKDQQTIRGFPLIGEVLLSGNKTTTIIINDYAARVGDQIIFECNSCKVEVFIGKRAFFRNKDLCLCVSCLKKHKSLIKYGVESPNQVKEIKEKQHKNNETNTAKRHKNEYTPEMRANNTKLGWLLGRYDNASLLASNRMKQLWADPEYRLKRQETENKLETKERRSRASIRQWQKPKYRELMSKIGIRVSKLQKQIYEICLLQYNDAILEYIIPNSEYTVDIFIPSKNLILEVYGDYWHCNPEKFNEDYYHSRLHCSAKEKWEKDKIRIDNLLALGYNIKILWEKEINDIGKENILLNI